MIRQLFISVVLLIVAGLLWFANLNYPNEYLEKGFYTAAAIAVLYMVKSFLEASVSSRISESRARYSFRKLIHFIYIVFLLFAAMTIWVKNPEALVVAYGLFAAGVAISLQDIFKNAAGGLVIYLTGVYKVGDRIEAGDKCGDVMDIGLMYTTIMEIKGWVAGDQVTGRLSVLPNSAVLSGTVNNYTKDHDFIWDEIKVPITYDSDWKEAHEKILKIARRETKKTSALAEKGLSKLGEKYFVEKRATAPAIFVRVTDNWIEFSLRYITNARERRSINNVISRKILEEIKKSKKIKIASQTIDIVGFPQQVKR